jgi:predicted RecA/RadA family phage recombinase
MYTNAKPIYPDGRYPQVAAAVLNPGDVVLRPDGSLGVVDGFDRIQIGQTFSAEPVRRCTVWEFRVASADTWAAGALLYWNNSTRVVTTSASGTILLGNSVAAKTSGQTLAQIVVF